MNKHLNTKPMNKKGNELIIKEFIPKKMDGEEAGSHLMELFKGVKMTKSNAVKLIALASALDKPAKAAKKYLGDLSPSGSYDDPDTGLIINRTTRTSKKLTSRKLTQLEAEVKIEKDRIRRGEVGKIFESVSNVFSLLK